VKETIAGELRACRARVRLNAGNAAKAIGVSERTLYSWERGIAMPPLDKAAALASIYNVSLDQFITECSK